jgi:hypothetical protein
MNTVAPLVDQAVEKLKQEWNRLSDPDRALALAEIKKSDLSNRKIATMLGRGETSIRRLLLLLHAPAADFAAAQNRDITTNELLRRAKDHAARRQAQRQQAAKIDAQHAAQKAADSICQWIIQENISGPDGERIIEEVRREFALREQGRSLPAHKFPKLPLEELIRKSLPARPHEDNAESVSWYHQWLFRWTFFAFPDPEVRDQALELALERQWKR